ncbi:TPA: hypothetical protein ACWXAY_002705 [Klebsiella pneumoniae]|uniref:hypothetical protein n=2 Tax=Klebsiella pneumoniae TaxID=573 RepID=UPI001F4DC734|nr:hypothetical protein [Klebsiella pneumoniae]MCH9367097.1 hypothetical protein [Klebsiella pneumoniae]MCH9545287.1 hypothetical protein [Klebsiella pneumoniae]HBQ8551587.1 hypothetical protein [Klebsiella pneumoniae]HBQ8571266.1 hypothetical protein [Klebsiella pneumoniae]HBY6920744.1 hypothetical protein [Klebsiella pneumoniae]
MANQFLTQCEKTVNAAAGRNLSEDEMGRLVSDMENTVKRIRAENEGISLEAAALRAAEELSNAEKLANVIEARNKALNTRIAVQRLAFIRDSFPDRPDIGLSAILVGRNEARTGSRSSASAEQFQLRSKYLSGLNHDLEQAGVLKYLSSGSNDAEVADAMWRLGKGESTDGMMKESVKIAEIITKWQETARLDANKAGAWIRKMPGYIARQGHDMMKIRAAGFASWRDAILPKLDKATFEGVADQDAFLRSVYDGLASGVHLASEKPDWMKGFKGSQNVARRASQERVLHFLDGRSWYEYNREFGVGSVREAIYGGLEASARNTGLMRILGTNPENMVNYLADTISADLKGNEKALAAFNDARRSTIKNEMAEVTGQTNIPGSSALARFGSTTRAVDSMLKLGGAMISSFNDLASNALELRYQGKNFMSALTESIQGRLKRYSTEEQKEILSSLGVYADSMRDEILQRFSGDVTLPGKVARLQRQFFRLNGLNWWTDASRNTTATMTSHWLAGNAKSPHATLNPDLKRALDLHGIGEPEWNIYRTMDMKGSEGRTFMTPDGIDSVPDDVIAKYIADKNVTVNERSIANARSELGDKLRGYILDRVMVAMTEPTARTRALMKQGTQPGTVQGELIRFIGQYKSFTASFMQQALGREVFGRGYTPAPLGQSRWGSVSNALFKSGKGEMVGLAQVALWMTFFGYLSMQTKLMLKGQTPRPADAKTFLAAAAQGGGLGIFGDFLFGEANRFGNGPITSLAGPVAGSADQLVTLFQKARSGDAKAGDFFRFTVDHTPFINLFWSRPILNYLFLNQLQESLSPGSLHRYEQNIRKNQGNDFLIPPSQFMLGR